MSEISSNIIKTALLAYLRFKNRNYVSTETSVFHGFIADILAYNMDSEYITEIEVKCNFSDLKNEITNKEYKHKHIYENSKYIFKPNKFYFCIPIELKDKALNFIKEVNNNYGLIAFERKKLPKNSVHIVKNAKLLHKEKSKDLLKLLMLRTTSDLCNKYEKLYW